MAIYISQLIQSLEEGHRGHCFEVREEGMDLVKKTLDNVEVFFEITNYSGKQYKLEIKRDKNEQ